MDHQRAHGLEYYPVLFCFLISDFEIFQVAVIFVSVVITNYLIMDGKSNWLEGIMLIGVYVIVAISYWLYPDFNADMNAGH